MPLVSALVDHRNGRGDCAAGGDCSPEGIDRMETASLSNEAKSDQAAEVQSRLRSLDARDLEDVTIVQPYRRQFFSPYAATVDGQ
jgi:hypothetical protein